MTRHALDGHITDTDRGPVRWRAIGEPIVNVSPTSCVRCGRELNPVQVMLSAKHKVCGDCTRALHKEATR